MNIQSKFTRRGSNLTSWKRIDRVTMDTGMTKTSNDVTLGLTLFADDGTKCQVHFSMRDVQRLRDFLNVKTT